MEEAVALPGDRRLVWGTYLVAAILLVFCWEPINLARLALDAHNNYDLGIFSQAIYQLSWSDPNPWLSVRETRIFNDHFEPVLVVAAPWTKAIEPALAGMLVEILFLLGSPLSVVWLWKRGLTSAGGASVAIAYLLHNRGTISALLYPFHPTTWAILPCAALAATMLADRRRGVLLSLLALCCCKEEFPLVGLMVALVYAWRREFRFALVVGSLSALWFGWAIWLRPLWLGPTVDYVSERLLASEGIGASLVRGWRELNTRAIWHLLLPLAPVVGWTLCRRPSAPGPVWLWLLILPCLGLRFLGRSWTFHYMAPLAPIIVLAMIPRGAQPRMPRGVVAAVMAILVAINAGFWVRSTKSMLDANARCPWNAGRLAAIERGREYLLAHPSGRALVEGNLVPRLTTRGEVYMLAAPHDPALDEFRYVFLEKPPRGDPWPASYPDFEHRLTVWRAEPGVRVIVDDEHVFLAEGRLRDTPPDAPHAEP